MSKRPSLMSELQALTRQGAKDLANAIGKAFPDSVQGVEEPGTPLNPMPQELTQERGVVERTKNDPEMELN